MSTCVGGMEIKEPQSCQMLLTGKDGGPTGGEKMKSCGILQALKQVLGKCGEVAER